MIKTPVFRVFVSSTNHDLVEYREKVRDAIESCEHLPIMQERFSAFGETPVDLCLRKVEEADIYVGIFAYRYGYCPDGNISITEMEFNKVQEMRMPILCFIVDEQFNWTNQVEDDLGKEVKLRNFKEKINRDYVRATFSTPENLALKVTHSLTEISRVLVAQHYQNQQNEINRQLEDIRKSQLTPQQIKLLARNDLLDQLR